MDFIAMAETLEAQAAALRRYASRDTETAPLPLEPQEAEWVEWTGGDQPADTYGKWVDYHLREGVEGTGPSGALTWDHQDAASDIVAYRLSAEQPAE
jgi:hypothetical protein